MTQADKESLEAVVAYLCWQLPAPNPRVRKSEKTMLESLATMTHCTVLQLVDHIIHPLIKDILHKPLKSFSRVVQVINNNNNNNNKKRLFSYFLDWDDGCRVILS
ncbi:hypothetical protein M1146_05535 [Patescibacteria group bacterium]|nr:hypothetical protein [Patescibacteria group bacterium]